MKVVIIGSGNVATALGNRIITAGHRILQVAGRNAATVTLLAAEWNCRYATDWKAIDGEADIYIVALADSALPGLGNVVSLPGRLVLHTAGALSVDTLRGVTDHAGVLYPLQSFRSGSGAPPEFPLLVDAAIPEDLPLIMAFASSLARQVVHANDTARLKLHVAAVLVNNFTNHLYTLAADFCHSENVDFSLLLPLIHETAQRIERFPPQDMQTGPALRGDAVTLEKHLRTISNYKNISEVYKLFTILIEEYYRSGQNPRPHMRN
jgi:predicted short-subunit dehydrogenase-like oxidoreductase (DUF2520 family)